ncbi:hypothetical protein [Paenibacillus sp. J2TS4]|nr:hypothetical protein [Paenibacillus sp. J2TS4]GIP32844.1 hypothetical protein J2TS4_20540 [Paenibacillus sp. J2TS4]
MIPFRIRQVHDRSVVHRGQDYLFAGEVPLLVREDPLLAGGGSVVF